MSDEISVLDILTPKCIPSEPNLSWQAGLSNYLRRLAAGRTEADVDRSREGYNRRIAEQRERVASMTEESIAEEAAREPLRERYARHLEKALERRSARSQAGVGPSAEVSGTGRMKSVRRATTDEEYIDKYAEGEGVLEDLPEKLQRKIRGH